MDLILRNKLATLRLSGQPIPHLPPHQSYKYLGVWVNVNLVWTEQFKATLNNLKHKGDTLLNCSLPLAIKLEMLHKVVRPTATYAFPLAIYTKQQIDSLDTALASYGRKIMNLPTGFPTTALLQPKEKGGAGLLSYHLDYKQLNVTQATKTLNDQGRLGLVSRKLLQHHYDQYTGVNNS